MSTEVPSGELGASVLPFLAGEDAAILLHTLALQARVATHADAVVIRLDSGQAEAVGPAVAVGPRAPLEELLARVRPAPLATAAPDGQVLRLERTLVVSMSLGAFSLGRIFIGLYRENGDFSGKDALVPRILANRARVAIATALVHASAPAPAPDEPSNGWLAPVLNQLAEGILVVDERCQVHFQNLALRRYSSEGPVNGSLPHLSYRSGAHLSSLQSPLQEALREGTTTLALECLAPGPRESAVPVLLSTAPIEIDGRPWGAVAIVQDVGPAEERACEQRVVVFGHDLRQPLNVITLAIGMAQRGGREALSEQQRKALDRIAQAAARLDGMIDHLVHR